MERATGTGAKVCAREIPPKISAKFRLKIKPGDGPID
jgi:hypothetical protein